MTTSAVARLIPRPPARVDSRKRNLEDPGSLNSSICVNKGTIASIASGEHRPEDEMQRRTGRGGGVLVTLHAAAM